jgi:emfourin
MGEEPFRIELVRTGGFGGLRLQGTVDVNQLPAEQAAALTGLLDRAGLAGGRDRPARPAAPDEFRYDLTVIRGDTRQHLVTGDRDASPELRELLARLVELTGRP